MRVVHAVVLVAFMALIGFLATLARSADDNTRRLYFGVISTLVGFIAGIAGGTAAGTAAGTQAADSAANDVKDDVESNLETNLQGVEGQVQDAVATELDKLEGQGA